MIDAIFYEDASVPEQWRERFPDWLVAIGLKVKKDLLERLSRAEDQGGAVQSVKSYLADRRLRRLEPIQVSLHAGPTRLYHDRIEENWRGHTSKRESRPRQYAFLDDLATNNFCVWEDVSANDINSVRRMPRHNLGLAARAERLGIQAIIELHWGSDFTKFETQVAHLRSLVRPIQVEVIDATEGLLQRLRIDPNEWHRIGPERFEDLVQNRIASMGFATQRTGKTFARDGGVDLLFWKDDAPFPFLGALQAKYHWSPEVVTGAPDVRDFAGTLRILPVAVGVLVTNTGFSFDARWVSARLGSHVRLRDQQDLRRWIAGRFVDIGDWREIPEELELCPGVIIRIPRGGIAGP